MINLIKKIIIARADWATKNWEYNLRCGVHSGFPLCCIAWFMIIHYNLGRTKNDRGRLIRDIYNSISKDIAKYRKLKYHFIDEETNKPGFIYGWGRIPCPICVFKSTKTGSIECNCGRNNKT